MAAFTQLLLLPLVLSPVSSWPHPYPWLPVIMQQQRPPQYPTYPVTTLDLQHNPFLAGMFQNPDTFISDANYILGQLPFNIHGHPAYVNDPYFTGYRPEDIDWNKVPEVPYGGDSGYDGSAPGTNNKPDIYDDQGGDDGANSYDNQGGYDNGPIDAGNNQDDSNRPYGYEDPKVNENQAGVGSRPQDADEDLLIDPRKEEAKYDKPH